MADVRSEATTDPTRACGGSQSARRRRAWISALLPLVLVVAWGASPGLAPSFARAESPSESSLPSGEPPAPRTVQPVDVVFVLDNSGSMKENDPDFLTREAVMDFATVLAHDPGIDGRVGVVLFDERSHLALGLTPIERGQTDELLRRALDRLDFSGQRTQGPAGIERALYELREKGRPEARRAIVFLSDGKIDTGDRRKDLEAAAWLRDDLAKASESEGVRIFGIAFTDVADYQLMQTLARRTGARYFRAFQAAELPGIVEEVLGSIRRTDLYDLASADARPFEGPGESSDVPPAVATGPASDDASSARGLLLGLIPAALLLAAGALYWRRRSRDPSADPVIAQAAQEMDAPPAQLLDVGGQLGEAGKAIPLARGQTRIGRDPHNDIVLDDDTISSEHAVIEVHGGRYWLEDRRSTNGTRLGDKRLEPDQRVQLKGGDHIRLADIDLMFVLTGYVPGGATVFVSSVTSPPPGWRAGSTTSPLDRERESIESARAAAADQEKDDVPVRAREHESERSARILDLNGRLQSPEPPAERTPAPVGQRPLSLLPRPDAEPDLGSPRDDEAAAARDEAGRGAESDPGESPRPPTGAHHEAAGGTDPTSEDRSGGSPAERPPPDQGIQAYRNSLDYHLERVAEISPAFAAFVERAFDAEIRSALSVAARDMHLEAPRPDRVQVKHYTFDRIRYVICGVPAHMNEARDAFLATFGGFSRMLAEELQAESFRKDRCEILTVLTFGLADSPWASLSIIPDVDHDPPIDLLSYEFLTEKERREIDPVERTDLSQSGLG